MDKNCEIVRDLIPLVADDIASEESKKFVENHCETCDECKKELWIAKQDIKTEISDLSENQVWENIEKSQRKKKIKTFNSRTNVRKACHLFKTIC